GSDGTGPGVQGPHASAALHLLAADDDVMPVDKRDVLLARPAVDHVALTVARMKGVVARPAEQAVETRPAVEAVVARAAEQRVVALASEERIVSSEPVERVVPVRAYETVGACRSRLRRRRRRPC